MAVEFLWRLPMHGDGRRAHDLHTRGEWNRQRASRVAPKVDDDDFGYIDYLSQVARAADIAGFHGALIPIFRFTEEPWVVAAALARETRRLRLLIALQPHFVHPVYAAQMAASLQRISRGRVEWNVVTGGGGPDQRAYGDFIDHDSRYARTDEFLDVVKGIAAGAPFSFDGRFYRVEAGGLLPPLSGQKPPRIYLAGASDAALAVAAKHGDVHLSWGEPLAKQKEVIDAARRALDRQNAERDLRFGMRIDILARETEEQAWAELRQMFATVGDATRAGFGGRGESSESVGAKRQFALHQGNTQHFDDLIVGPNLWAGMSQIRGGPGCVIVGSHEQVAERLAEYVDIGVSTFILASNPHLEEAYRVGEEVLPLVDGALNARGTQAALRVAGA
ncbi:alkanesulfonate monooxygenase [Burkholderia seminalis]|uniref:LLM class flavin-dependent oxidoreductase n=1 Tax=Burkholderia seminalis TaxID=488731 RepID=UPI0008416586|nr:LLM class flavin-dependent oxidoreductase [Burkholderia seminalis]AOJ29815.1 alkanesulfonate monooxygenase [Burkholderia seminalis]MBJ9592128.1 LLM class flavin-dependent oxidoreductase [Burkholderia seminalis]MCA8039645.1 LLM class flavin-dependent oxidoreductase [Burkholderia seminalis]MCA8423026.1 LLM class flavin-dependent oxidoreductase [Burkholderia seminalis]RQS97769.1 LLM class flavin-dependent oxidoreductase [Burkholderia seminalis]